MSTGSHESDLLDKEPKIRRALEEASGKGAGKSGLTKSDRHKLLIFALVIIFSLIVQYLLQAQFIAIPEDYLFYVSKFFQIVVAIAILMLLVALIRIFLIRKINDTPTQYNLHRVLNLLAGILVILIILTALYSNWYAAVISLGLISLILGFALQNPITSFFAWVFVMVRKPYEVGDRIKIGPVTGDVIEVGYLDTTLWEFNGDYLSGDHPSGRIIRFSNAKAFDEYIINYSWPLFPYIWTEIRFHVGFDSDLAYIEQVMKQVVEAEIGEEMLTRIQVYRNLLKETPIDEMEVNERPSVFFRASENTWLEVVVRFLVEPKKEGRMKRILSNKLITALKEDPARVKFPN